MNNCSKNNATIILLLCMIGSLFLQCSNAAEFTVANTSQLNTAIAAANGGDKIKLAAGDYGAIDIKNKRLSRFLTIVSANKNKPAKLGNIEVANSSFIRLDSIEVEGNGSQVIYIRLGSSDIEVINSDIHGQLLNRQQNSADDFTASFGVRVLDDAARVRLENNTIHDVKNATAVFSGNDITLRGNRCDWVQSDCYKFAGVDTLLFENNFGARNVIRKAPSHPDFMQAQGFVRNGIFRGNVAMMGNESFQGLFFGGNDASDAHVNNLIENNIIYIQHGNGITFNEYSSRNAVRFNTVLHSTKDSATNVSVAGDVKEFNVIVSRASRGRIEGTNHYIQYEDTTEPLHYNRYYKDLDKDAALVTIEDFRPIENSPAASQVGAFKRIYELLGGEQATTVFPVPVINLLLDDD